MHLDKPEFVFDCEYKGGHLMYPQSSKTRILIYSDGIYIEELGLNIPFNRIIKIDNKTEKIASRREVLLYQNNWVANAMTKERLYTVLHIIDELNLNQMMIFDFKKQIQEAQQIIFRRSVEASRNKQSTNIQSNQSKTLINDNSKNTNLNTNTLQKTTSSSLLQKENICERCNSKNAVNFKFCNQCGNRLI